MRPESKSMATAFRRFLVENLILAGSAIITSIGLIGLLAWRLHHVEWIRFGPDAPAFKPDSALGFALAGCALAFTLRTDTRSCWYWSVPLFYLGLQSLFRGAVSPLLAVFVGVTGTAPEVGLNAHELCMAGAAAVVLCLFGLCLILHSFHAQPISSFWINSLLATSIISMGIFGIVTQAVMFGGTGWFTSSFSPMSLPAAICSLLLGCLFCCVLWRRAQRAGRNVEISALIQTKIALLLVLGSVGLAIGLSSSATEESGATLIRLQQRIRTVHRLLNTTESLSNAQRGYLLTGHQVYLDEYRANVGKAQALIHQIADPAFSVVPTGRLVEIARQQMEALHGPISLELLGRHAAAIDQFRSGSNLLLNSSLQRESAQVITSMQREIDGQSRMSNQASRAVKTTATVLLAVAFCISLFTLGVVIRSLRRNVRFTTSLLANEADLEDKIWQRTLDLESEIVTRTQVEGLLRRSEERLSASLSFAGMATWNWKPDEDTIVWHGPVAAVFGVGAEALKSFADLRKLTHPDDRVLLTRSASIGVDYDVEFRIIRPDGEVRWIAGRGGAVMDRNRIVEMSGVHFDITDRKFTQQQLQQNERILRTKEEQLSMMYDGGTIGNFYWEIETDKVTCRPSIWKLYGAPDKCEAPAAWFTEKQHPADRDLVGRVVNQALKSEARFHVEYRVVRPDSSVRWLSCRGLVIRNSTGKAIGVNGLVIDITEQKQTEEELQRSVREFRSLANAMPQIVWTATADGAMDYYNDGWYRLTQSSRGSSDRTHWLSIIHPDDVDAVAANWNDAILHGRNFEQEMRYWNRASNSYEWYLSRAVPFRDHHGNLLRWFGTSTDIHQQKLAAETLESEVQLRTEELQKSLGEKQVLLKELHHRVKNNLQVIASLLKMQSGGLQDVTAIAALEESRQRVFSMALVHERLYGNQQLTHLEIGGYARTLMHELVRSYARSSKISLSLETVNVLLPIDQAIPCGLILNELVSNALKYAFPEDTGGELDFKLHVDSAGMITMSVTDNGIGLARDFDWKELNSIGLSIVDILSRQLGGSWHVDRTCPGASFTVKFPHPEEVHRKAA